jgi:hypothetical protein
MRPPKLIKPYVETFVRQVISGSASAFYVPCAPQHGAPQNECFALVNAHVAKHGGAAVLGWVIWERPKVFIEAEFHAIWRTPDNQFIDIVPRGFPIPRILFVEDPRRKYNGTQVDNVRKSIAKDKDVERFLFLRGEHFRLLNEGDLKHQFGEIPATPKMLANIKEATSLEYKLLNRYGAWLPEETAPTK